jgi:hypothetical protein
MTPLVSRASRAVGAGLLGHAAVAERDRVGDGAAVAAAARVDRHPRSLVQDDEARVFVQDMQGQVLRLDGGRQERRHVDVDPVAVVHAGCGSRGAPVEQDRPRLDQPLDGGAAERRQPRAEIAVQPRSRVRRGHVETSFLGLVEVESGREVVHHAGF